MFHGSCRSPKPFEGYGSASCQGTEPLLPADAAGYGNAKTTGCVIGDRHVVSEQAHQAPLRAWPASIVYAQPVSADSRRGPPLRASECPGLQQG